MPSLRDTPSSHHSEWDAGLLWGGAALLLALVIGALILPDLHAVTRQVPTLSPATLAELGELGLDPRDPPVVFVEGFVPDCGDPQFDGRDVLVPAWSPERDAAILIAFDRVGACPALAGSFRGRASVWGDWADAQVEARVRWGLPEPARRTLVVDPLQLPRGPLAVVLGLLVLAAAGVVTAARTRRRLLAERAPAERAPIQAEDPVDVDPYRPAIADDRLLPAGLRPAPRLLARLRRRRALDLTLGLGLIGSSLVWVARSSASFSAHTQVWTHGEVPPEADARGRTELVFPGVVRTTVEVTYVDAEGRRRRDERAAWSLLARPDTAARPVVRYLPASPDQFAVSWLHEQRRGTWAWITLIGAVLGLGGLPLLGRARIDRARQLEALFAGGREVLLDLQHVEQDHNLRIHRFGLRDSHRAVAVRVRDGEVGPLALDRQGTGLALYSPHDRANILVLSEDLSELERPPFTAEQLRERYWPRSGQGDRPRDPRPPRRARRRRRP